MARSVKQNEQMREATKTAVLNAAMTLFAQNGYAHTTTRAIAKEADISVGLMYHYFAGKESLLLAVYDHCMGRINASITAVLLQNDPENNLRHVLDAIFRLLAEDAPFWTLFNVLRTQPATVQIIGSDLLVSTQNLRSMFVDEFRQKGHQEPEIDAYLLYSLVEGTIQQYLLEPEQYPLAQVVSKIFEQFNL